LNKPEVCYLC